MSQLIRQAPTQIIPGPVLPMAVPSQPPAANARPRKILVVDDNLVIVKAVAIKLKSRGYEVITAMDGSEAVSAVRREKPDLIVLDINFPPDVAHGGGVPWDGFLILSWVRRIDEARHTPVIFITSSDASQYKDQVLQSGALALFQKPLNFEELLSMVRRTIGDGNVNSHGGPGTVVRI